jgi:hypothetical protein
VEEAIDIYFDASPLMDADIVHEIPKEKHGDFASIGAIAPKGPPAPLQPPVAAALAPAAPVSAQGPPQSPVPVPGVQVLANSLPPNVGEILQVPPAQAQGELVAVTPLVRSRARTNRGVQPEPYDSGEYLADHGEPLGNEWEAFKSPEDDKWQAACRQELVSMAEEGVDEMIALPPCAIQVGSRVQTPRRWPDSKEQIAPCGKGVHPTVWRRRHPQGVQEVPRKVLWRGEARSWDEHEAGQGSKDNKHLTTAPGERGPSTVRPRRLRAVAQSLLGHVLAPSCAVTSNR